MSNKTFSKAKLALVAASLLFGVSAFAQTASQAPLENSNDLSSSVSTVYLPSNLGINIPTLTLAPGATSVIDMPWYVPLTITAYCTVTTAGANVPIHGYMKKGTASIDGHDVGSGYTILVNNNQQFTLVAHPHSSTVLTNQGNATIVAKCHT